MSGRGQSLPDAVVLGSQAPGAPAMLGSAPSSPAGLWLPAMPTGGQLEPLALLSASAGYFPFSAS